VDHLVPTVTDMKQLLSCRGLPTKLVLNEMTEEVKDANSSSLAMSNLGQAIKQDKSS